MSSSREIDPHRDNVYAWEDSWPGWGHNQLGLKACRALVKLACDFYKVEQPIVVQHDKRTFSWSMPTKNRISIQGGAHFDRGGRNVATVLHEAAHHIAWMVHGDRIQDHGATWLGIYLDLLVRAKVAPEVALVASLKPFHLNYRRKK